MELDTLREAISFPSFSGSVRSRLGGNQNRQPEPEILSRKDSRLRRRLSISQQAMELGA
jgi:hypothetical protein